MKKRTAIWLASLLCVSVALCGACSTTEGEQSELPHDHVWLPWEELIPATCTTAGREIRYCAGDETHFEEREIESKGHSVEEWFPVEGGHRGFCDECFNETEVQEHTFENGVCSLCGMAGVNEE